MCITLTSWRALGLIRERRFAPRAKRTPLTKSTDSMKCAKILCAFNLYCPTAKAAKIRGHVASLA